MHPGCIATLHLARIVAEAGGEGGDGERDYRPSAIAAPRRP